VVKGRYREVTRNRARRQWTFKRPFLKERVNGFISPLFNDAASFETTEHQTLLKTRNCAITAMLPNCRIICSANSGVQLREQRICSGVDHNQVAQSTGGLDAYLSIGVIQSLEECSLKLG
jgi:hypothetical protein